MWHNAPQLDNELGKTIRGKRRTAPNQKAGKQIMHGYPVGEANSDTTEILE